MRNAQVEYDFTRPSPHGEGGLKLLHRIQFSASANGPSPHGEGGLKFRGITRIEEDVKSLPARGGWIEMQVVYSFAVDVLASLPARGGWIEMTKPPPLALYAWSLPARGGWIEIALRRGLMHKLSVPPRTGRVD
jgi:hypothetical protein